MANKDFMENFNKYRVSKSPLTFPLDVTKKSDDYEITGTAPALVASIILPLFSKKIWTWFIGLITDGYWMTLLSPFILTYWVLATIIFLPVLCVLGILFVISSLWCFIIEVPASIMNKERLNFFRNGGNGNLSAVVIWCLVVFAVICLIVFL
jgi:hypothetical protein